MRTDDNGVTQTGGAAPPLGRRLCVLILNWRDCAHPKAGGAERVTHEIARRWVSWGHQVTLFSAAFPGAVGEQYVDGVRIVRRGSQATVHWEAYWYYRGQHGGAYDVVIDEVNTIPFFAPLYARCPVVMFSHQLAREVWRYEAPFPLSAVGYLAEPLYLQVYRCVPIMTVSRSTRTDLRRLGLRGPCRVIPEAVDTRAPEVLPDLGSKEDALTLVFVGRVVPSKRVDHIVRALALIRRSQRPGAGPARLWIVGSWDDEYRRTLDCLIATLGLRDQVTFFGRVDEAAKERLLARAHVFVMASVREGWGLVVTEANVLGTPAVVYDVPGLRDSTIDEQTGVVCRRNTPSDLAAAIVALHVEPERYLRLRRQAWAMAKQLNWDQTARAAWEAVEAFVTA